MTVLALIPARGGSKGIPRKNIRQFCGKPLLQWSIDVALASACIDQVVVSTDDLEIAEIAINAGAEVPFIRPSHLALDSTPGIDPVLHALDSLPEVTDVCLLQPTSPLRTAKDIEAVFHLRANSISDSAVSLCLASKHPALMYHIEEDHHIAPISKLHHPHCRQSLPIIHALNGAIFLAYRDFLQREKSFITPDTLGYVMPPQRSVDIDTDFDWQIAELLMTSNL